MSRIWKIRIGIACAFVIAVYMGYGVWNDYFDKQEVLEGASWEVPLNMEYGSWDYELRSTEAKLGSLGLSLEKEKEEDSEGYSKIVLGVTNQDRKIIVPPIYEYLRVELEEGYILGENYFGEGVYDLEVDPTGIREYIGSDREVAHYYNYDGTDFVNVPIKGELLGADREYIFVERDKHKILLNREGETLLDLENINIDRVFDKERGIFEFSNYNPIYSRAEYGTGLIDASGKILLEAKYDSICRVSMDRIYACYANSADPKAGYFYLDNDFNILSGKQYEYINTFEEGVATVKDSTGWHIIDENEEIIADIPKALDVQPFSEGIAVAQYKKEFKYIDTKGIVLFSKPLPSGEEDMGEAGWLYSEGRITFIGENKEMGFMDKKGREIVKPTFRYATSSSNGEAYVDIGFKGGVIRF